MTTGDGVDIGAIKRIEYISKKMDWCLDSELVSAYISTYEKVYESADSG